MMLARSLCAAGLVVWALALLSACATLPIDRSLTATLLTAGDTVEVNGRSAVPGQPIRSGDSVYTGTESSALVEFSDQTRVQIIDAVDPVYLNWSGTRLVLRMDDAAVEADKGFFFRIIEAIGALARSFHESRFVVEEKRSEFFRIDLFSGRARLVEPRVDRELAPGEYARVTPGREIEFGRTSRGRLQELRSRFDRWKFAQPVRVPDLTDRRLDEALALIERSGLRRGRIRGPREAESTVVDQNPGAGTRVERDARIDLTVRSAKVVPDVRKLSPAEARQTLSRSGLRSGRIRGAQSGERYVVSQTPNPGMRVPSGSSVDLVFKARELPPIRVPDVRQLLLREAEAKLKQAGLRPGRIDGGPGGDAFYVIKQDPPPQTRVNRGSRVDLWVRGVIE